jgi:hypothetical protein
VYLKPKEPFSPWNILVCRNYSFQNITQVSLEKRCYMLLLLTQVLFFWGIQGFLQFSWIGLFATKWALLHLENYHTQELFLSKLTQFSEGDNAEDAAASIIDGCLWRDTCVSSPQLNRPIWSKKCLSPPRSTYFSRSISFKSSLSYHRETMCCCFCFYTDGFPSRDTCVSSSKMNWWICSKRSLFHLEKFGLQEELLSKTNWVLMA